MKFGFMAAHGIAGPWRAGNGIMSPHSDETEDDSEPFLFLEEDETDEDDLEAKDQMPWRILIVDDDEDVHRSTQFALGGETVLGCPLYFHHAYSLADAIDVLRQCDGIAVALVDVVMETQDAGLKLARYIRDELNQNEIRIVIRTGQPGTLSEKEASETAEINRYLLKSQMTQAILMDAITAEIRQYQAGRV